MTEIVTLLTSGIVQFGSGLGQGISSFVEELVLNEAGTLSSFGGIVVIFAGISLAVGITALVFRFVTSLGGSK